MAGDFTAFARIPGRPLSYEYADMALPKEFVIDYTTGDLYICDLNGVLINVTDAIKNKIIGEIDGNNIIITLIDSDGKEFKVRLGNILQELYDRLYEIEQLLENANIGKVIFPIYNEDPENTDPGEGWLIVD